MRTKLAILSLVSAIAATTASTIAYADTSLEDRITIEATWNAARQVATIVIQGADGGVTLDKTYPVTCTLRARDGGMVEKSVLKKEDGKYEDDARPGRAKKLTFSIRTAADISGECKIVACTTSDCPSPFKVSFSTATR